MAAVTHVSHPHSPGRAHYDRKIAEGKTGKEALRSLNRRISDIIHAALIADAHPQTQAGPGGQTGNVSVSSGPAHTPRHRLFGPATPGPEPSLRPAANPHPGPPLAERKTASPLDKQRGLVRARLRGGGRVFCVPILFVPGRHETGAHPLTRC